jgi:hypothetical protein
MSGMRRNEWNEDSLSYLVRVCYLYHILFVSCLTSFNSTNYYTYNILFVSCLRSFSSTNYYTYNILFVSCMHTCTHTHILAW